MTRRSVALAAVLVALLAASCYASSAATGMDDSSLAMFNSKKSKATPADGTAAAGTATDGTATDGTGSAETTTDATAADGTAAAGTATDGTATDGTATDGTAPAGTATDGTATDGTASDGTAAAETTTDATAADGTAPAGTATDGTATDGTATDGTAAAETTTDATAADGTAAAGTATDGTASAGTATDGTASAGTATDGTAPAGTATDGTATDGTATDGTAAAETTTDATAADGTAPAGTATDGTAPAGTATDGTAPAGTATDGTASADSVTPAVPTAPESEPKSRKVELTEIDTPPPEWMMPTTHLNRGVDVLLDEESVRPIFQWRYGGSTDPLTGDSPHKKEMNLQDLFYVPDQLEVAEEAKCVFTSETKTFKSASEYSSSLAASAGVSFDLAGLGAFSASASFSRAAQETAAGERSLVRAEAECAVASVVLHPDEQLLHPSFKAMLDGLPDPAKEVQRMTDVSDEDRGRLEDFISTYGTHYVAAAKLGGVITRDKVVTVEELSRMSSVGGGVVATMTASSESSSSSESSDVTVHARGGAPGSFGNGDDFDTEWGSWAATLPRNPVLIQRTLRPLSDFVRKDSPLKASLLDRAIRRYVKDNAHLSTTEYALVMQFDGKLSEELEATASLLGNVGRVTNMRFKWSKPGRFVAGTMRALGVGNVKTLEINVPVKPTSVLMLNVGAGVGYVMRPAKGATTAGVYKYEPLVMEVSRSNVAAVLAAGISGLLAKAGAKPKAMTGNLQADLTRKLVANPECGMYTVTVNVRDYRLLDANYQMVLHLQGSSGVVSGVMPLTSYSVTDAYKEFLEEGCSGAAKVLAVKKDGGALLGGEFAGRRALVAVLAGPNVGTMQSLRVELRNPKSNMEPKQIHEADALTQTRLAKDMCNVVLDTQNGIRECDEKTLEILTKKMQETLKMTLQRDDEVIVDAEQCKAVLDGMMKSAHAQFSCKPNLYHASFWGVRFTRPWVVKAKTNAAKRVVKGFLDAQWGMRKMPYCEANKRDGPVLFREPCSQLFPQDNPEPFFSASVNWDKQPRMAVSQAYALDHRNNAVHAGQFNTDITPLTPVQRAMI